MTIKRRLFISNILMIVIPIVLALMLSALLALLLWKEFDFKFGGNQDYYDARDSVMQAAEQFVSHPEASQSERVDFVIDRVKKLLENNDMALRAYATFDGKAIDDKPEYSLGSETFVDASLNEALNALGGTGIVGKNGRELYVSQIPGEDGTGYRIEVYSTRTPEDAQDAQSSHRGGWIPIALLLGMITVVFLTSRFLTRFVFQKIRQPLEILADGVNQIRDGNLDYRIRYARKDEFRPVCEAFNEMAGRLKESVWAVQKQEMNRKELLAGISHDLRSPLTSIKAYSEGLLDGVATTEDARHRYVKMIKSKAEDIDHMVSRLFLFSKMDLGDYPNYPEDLDLREELGSFFRAVAEEYAQQGLVVKIGRLEQDVALHADPVQFRRVLANIVENSLKYKERPEVTVSVETVRRGDTARIEVEDDGPGVTDEALPKLFDVFYRSDASRSSPNRGSGLGLAISEKAVAFMDGKIWAEHGRGGGLRIVIELPIADDKGE